MKDAKLLCCWTFACTLISCREPTREWTPADHDGAGPAAPLTHAATASASTTRSAAEEIAELTWARQCQACHGPDGRGDGPQGPMVRASDLTRRDWLTRVTDEDIAKAIRQGKGRMPAFDFPEPTVKALVARIRAKAR